MIRRLYIKDYAIIDEVNINFKSGLTVITGETGSGKSLLLEALGVALGAKADKLMVRNGSRRAVIETEFTDRLIRRLISSKGKTKSFQNDEPLSIINLKKNNEAKVDFHGQNEHQLILNSKSHIDYLDLYCNHKGDVESLGVIYAELFNLRSKLDLLRKSSQNHKNKLELLKFQASEIDAIDPLPEEDYKLDQKYKKLCNIENIIETLQNIQRSLNDNDESLIDQLAKIQNDLNSIQNFEPKATKIIEFINNSMIQLEEACSIISSQLLKTDFNQNDIYEIEGRISALESLKRKYGGSIESVIEERRAIQKELISLKNPEKTEKNLSEAIIEKENIFSKKAIEIHKRRKKKSKELSKKIEDAMSGLNMPESKFIIRIDTDEAKNGFVSLNQKLFSCNPKGIDIVEFYLSTNLGEPVKPLSLVASGGEVSRIMLAIKTVFQDSDPVNTLVFDEVDSGISGKAAEMVAKHLSKISKTKQVICITHLSQIARHADQHLHIVKYVKENQTFVDLKYLNKNESSNIIQDLFVGRQKAKA